MEKLKIASAILIFCTSVYAVDQGSSTFQDDEAFFSQDILTEKSRKNIEDFSPWKRYVSVDLALIPSLAGVFNLGIRREGEKHGCDFGISSGKGNYFIMVSGYGSYLRFIDTSSNAKYYGGVGLKIGHTWSPHEMQCDFTNVLFSIGSSFKSKLGKNQFFQVDLITPTFYHLHNSDKSYKKFVVSYRRVDISAYYGIYF